jgi:hypothetical protein
MERENAREDRSLPEFLRFIFRYQAASHFVLEASRDSGNVFDGFKVVRGQPPLR